jgi:hypothetical protein
MRVFFIGFGIAFAVSLTFPIAVKACLPTEIKPTRWIQNCPPFSVFMLSAFPIAIGILAVTIVDLSESDAINIFAITTYGSRSVFVTAVAILLVMIVFAFVIVFDDFCSRPIGPHILRGARATEAFKLEKELRDAAKRRTESPRRSRGPRHRPNSAATNLRKNERYQELIRLPTLSAIYRNGNFVAASYLAIGLLGTACCAFYIWLIGVLLVYHQKLPGGTLGKLQTIFILLITWFPMRVHMDWYQNYFHNADWLKKSWSFWMGIIVALASLVAILVIANPDAPQRLLTLVQLLIFASLGVLSKFKPQWLHAIADALQSMPFVYFVGAYLVILFLSAAFGFRILHA